MDTMRGEDSTGIAAIKPERPKDYVFYKRALAGPDFLRTRIMSDFYKDADEYSFILGHNRKATIGNVNDVNAHPYYRHNIILTHNGSLTNHNTLYPSFRTKLGIETDSELICEMLNNHTVDKLIPKLQGAFSLVWYDYRDKSVNFIRNDKRPMHFATIKDRNVMFYASEPDMLRAAIRRCANTYAVIEEEKELLTGMHAKITTSVEENKWQVQEVELHKPATTTYNSNSSNHSNMASKSKAAYDKHNVLLSKYGLRVGQRIDIGIKSVDLYQGTTGFGYMESIALKLPKLRDIKIKTFQFNINNYSMRYHFTAVVRRMHTTAAGADELIVDELRENFTSRDNLLAQRYRDHRKASKQLEEVSEEKVVKFPITREKLTLRGHSVRKSSQRTANRDYSGPRKGWYRKSDFEKLVSDGCGWCGLDLSPEEHASIIWTADDKPVCPDCVKQHGSQIFNNTNGTDKVH